MPADKAGRVVFIGNIPYGKMASGQLYMGMLLNWMLQV